MSFILATILRETAVARPDAPVYRAGGATALRPPEAANQGS